jgi:hypothetical protein
MTNYPKELESTVCLVFRAFPEGLAPGDIRPLARVLYDHMGDRQLAVLIAALAGIAQETALNAVWEAAALDIDGIETKRVRALLDGAGFDMWSEQE